MIKKNVSEVEFSLWQLTTKCIGFEWQVKNSACRNDIFINEKDVRKRKIKARNEDSNFVYGFICPACGCFTIIKENKIPEKVKVNAKELATLVLK